MANTTKKHEDLPKSEPPVAGCSNKSNILYYVFLISLNIRKCVKPKLVAMISTF